MSQNDDNIKSGLSMPIVFLVRAGGLCLRSSGFNRRVIKGISSCYQTLPGNADQEALPLLKKHYKPK
jgi:hypothetical protein